MNLQSHIATIKELDSIIEGLFKHCTNRERKCMYVTIVELECEPLLIILNIYDDIRILYLMSK